LYAAYAGEVGRTEQLAGADGDERYGARLDALARAAAGVRQRYGMLAVPWSRALRMYGFGDRGEDGVVRGGSDGSPADTTGTDVGRAVLAGPPEAGIIAAMRPASFPGFDARGVPGAGAPPSTNAAAPGSSGAPPASIESARVWVMIARLGTGSEARSAVALDPARALLLETDPGAPAGPDAAPLAGADRLKPFLTDWSVLEEAAIRRYSPGRAQADGGGDA
jgi:hypothetical protein